MVHTRFTIEDLTDELLAETYIKAVKYELSEDFILILEQEIKRRNLNLPNIYKMR